MSMDPSPNSVITSCMSFRSGLLTQFYYVRNRGSSAYLTVLHWGLYVVVRAAPGTQGCFCGVNIFVIFCHSEPS